MIFALIILIVGFLFVAVVTLEGLNMVDPQEALAAIKKFHEEVVPAFEVVIKDIQAVIDTVKKSALAEMSVEPPKPPEGPAVS